MAFTCSILDSSGVSHSVNDSVLASDGTAYSVGGSILDSAGVEWLVCTIVFLNAGADDAPLEHHQDERILMMFVKQYMKKVI